MLKLNVGKRKIVVLLCRFKTGIMNQVVLITGASSGIGKSVALYLAQKGYKVYGTSRKPMESMEGLVKMLVMDVRDESAIQSAIKQLFEIEGRLDILINNAGIGITGAVEELPMEEVKKHFDTNFFGPISVMQAVLPIMRNQKSGLIINITSIAGYMGLPFRGVYSASKGALELLTEAISMEVKSFGIDVVNVAPGDFATNIASGRYHAPLKSDSAYRESYGKTLDMMNEHVDAGNNPLEMALAIEKIILTQNRKIHYKVGAWLQKFSIVLKRILPDRVYEKMLMNHYQMK
jgi:NAD(P)-dependent dehydrogenase (short-subunit alcohol dehydrogenase family)